MLSLKMMKKTKRKRRKMRMRRMKIMMLPCAVRMVKNSQEATEGLEIGDICGSLMIFQ